MRGEITMKGNVRISFRGLTELDRLELEKAVGREHVETERQETREGSVGDAGSLTAIVEIALDLLPEVATFIAIWLAAGRRKTVIKNVVEVETDEGRISQNLYITSKTKDGISDEIVKQLKEMASQVGKK